MWTVLYKFSLKYFVQCKFLKITLCDERPNFQNLSRLIWFKLFVSNYNFFAR
jgi:hypothetical protein